MSTGQARSRSSHQEDDLLWTNSATGDRFPSRPSVTHPLWQNFLDSGSSSPTQFFRAFLAPPSYFHSPTPWRSHGRLVQKVSELLDSFRPGAYSYRPFRKEDQLAAAQDLNNNVRLDHPVTTGGVEVAVAEDLEPTPAEEEADDVEENVPAVAANAVVRSPTEESRRRLYVDLGRPRPFYRRQQSLLQSEESNEAGSGGGGGGGVQMIAQQPRTLQDSIRVCLIREFGLHRLREILCSSSLSSVIPCVVRDQMLTFLCEHFEEISDPPHCSPSLARKTGSYKVRCLLDGKTYMAIFAASEVDKHVSNLWDEYRSWLYWDDPNVLPILSLVADPLTENAFFVVQDFPPAVSDAENVGESLKEKLARAKAQFETKLKEVYLPSDLLREDYVFLAEDGTIMLQNPLLFAKFRLKLKETMSMGNDASLSAAHKDLIRDLVKSIS